MGWVKRWYEGVFILIVESGGKQYVFLLPHLYSILTTFGCVPGLDERKKTVKLARWDTFSDPLLVIEYL